MVSWSCLGRSIGINILKSSTKTPVLVQNVNFSIKNTLCGEQRSFVIQPSRWQWHKFKDMFHLYLMVGVIPVAAIIFYANVFIGPAELRPITECDDEPKYWEYHRHPITRFIARYIHNNPQQEYEKFMHAIDEQAQKAKLVGLEKEIKKKMAEREDYQAFYYRPMVNKYLRHNRRAGENVDARLGENYKD